MLYHKTSNSILYWSITFISSITIGSILLLLFYITYKGIGVINWEFITTTSDNLETGGILAPIIGTCYITGLTILLSMPFGILAAIYMSEYLEKGRFFNLLELVIANLAGIPSIVYGLFGLGLFLLYLNLEVSILSGALTMSCLVLPILITVSYQALQEVPISVREASYALGASRLQTTFYVVLPMAFPKILTAIILSISRSAGETAPLLFTAAVYYMSQLPNSIHDKTMVLSYHLFATSTQTLGMPMENKYAITLVLLMLVFFFNGLATLLRSFLNQKYKWK